MKVLYDRDADLDLIRRRRVAVIGYGSQGHAHALNLRDSGVDVAVGLPPSSSSSVKAKSAGFHVTSVGDATGWADVVVLLVPDQKQRAIYENEIRSHLSAGKALLLAHGFSIRFRCITPPSDVDVVMVAPKAPGQRLREVFVEGGGTPALVAMHQDATGNARALALSYACAIGCTRAGVLETTFADETETDLFGEQAVLCGGVSALVKAGFEVLVEAGYAPELAYFECLHELKLIVDLLYRGGLNYMRYSISDTAEWGDYTAGPRIITNQTKDEMRALLREIQSGEFAHQWIKEYDAGLPHFTKMRERDRGHQVEVVGARLRTMMPFLDPVTVAPPLSV